MLAFAHVPAELRRLAEREPFVGRVCLGRLGHPKRDDIRAAVRPVRERVGRHPALRPGAYPWRATQLELRYDAVRDRNVFFAARRSSRTRARAWTLRSHRCLLAGRAGCGDDADPRAGTRGRDNDGAAEARPAAQRGPEPEVAAAARFGYAPKRITALARYSTTAARRETFPSLRGRDAEGFLRPPNHGRELVARRAILRVVLAGGSVSVSCRSRDRKRHRGTHELREDQATPAGGRGSRVPQAASTGSDPSVSARGSSSLDAALRACR